MADKVLNVEMVVPDLGLNSKQLSALKRKFQAQIVESMGGREAMARARVRVVIRVRVTVIVAER